MLRSIWGLFAPAAIWRQEYAGDAEMRLRLFSARYQEGRRVTGGVCPLPTPKSVQRASGF